MITAIFVWIVDCYINGHQKVFQSVKSIRTFDYTETNEIGINEFKNLKHVHDISEPRSRGNRTPRIWGDDDRQRQLSQWQTSTIGAIKGWKGRGWRYGGRDGKKKVQWEGNEGGGQSSEGLIPKIYSTAQPLSRFVGWIRVCPQGF